MSDYKRRSYDREPRDDSDRSPMNKYDDPPNSRLFIVCAKSITEEDFKEAFEEYGTIEEIWVLKDRVTGDSKGVVYIKFTKTSEAALAMEEMNGKCVGSHPRPLKVMIAHAREQGSRRESNEEERLVRLFVVVPKSQTESELKDHFDAFGDVDYVSIVKDRTTKEAKGFGYVKYHRMSHAAKAFEGCDRSYKPVFADPKPQKMDYHGDRMGGPGSTASGSTSASMSAGYDMLSYMDTSHSNPEGNCRLQAVCSPNINQDQLWRLFDLVPGLDYCELKDNRSRTSRDRSKAYGIVVYNNPQSATYAKEKLHGFEYPPGYRMIVRFDMYEPQGGGGGYGMQMGPPRGGGYPMGGQNQMGPPGGYPNAPRMTSPQGPPQFQNTNRGSLPPDLQSLADTISQATAAIQAAGYGIPNQGGGGGGPGAENYDPGYCSAKLPPPQPLAPTDARVEERLFVVCTPRPPAIYALKDVFGRFGNLIDIYMLNNKTCGYAKYASKDSAVRAVEALHQQEVCGARLKVMTAEPRDNDNDSRKRPKMMDQD